MKTVGQIIKAERQRKNLSLESLSHLTKIDLKYLEAIESDDYQKLPSETFSKGFIRNIASRLERDPNELVAIFRRDYRLPEKKTTQKIRPQKINFHHFSFFQYAPLILGVAVFFLYLAFQFRVILTPPKLEIATPSSGSVLVSPLVIEGTTSVDSYLRIGEDVQVRPDENGNFSAKINLPLGETDIQVISTNRFGRSTTKKLSLIIISK